MNLDQLKKNINQRVQLRPIARRFDNEGLELEQIDDDWVIQEVSNGGVQISNIRTAHTTILGRDHVHHFTSNPDRSQSGTKHGFLTLNVQISLRGQNLSIDPNSGPGMPVGAQPPSASVTAAAEPTVNMQSIFLNQLRDGEYHSRVGLTIDSSYPPGNLFIAVHAPTIRRIALVPQRTGIVMMGHCGNRNGMSFANMQHPFGLIHLEVITAQPENLDIEWDLK